LSYNFTMPSTKAFYLIESAEMKDDGSPYVEMRLRRVFDPSFNTGAPETLVERFDDLERAHDLINCGERIACMVTQWLGKTATSMVAKESELPSSVTA
jgi:hypothetical protein